MNWKEVLDEIQSGEFDATLNVVSSDSGYFHAVEKHPTVREAYRQMLESGELREDAIGRIFDLVSEEIDPRFENPHDTPLAVLLWLTAFAANDSVRVAASYVDQAPQCWYAKKLAQRILHPPQSPSNTWDFAFSQEPQSSPSVKAWSGSTDTQIPPMMERPMESYKGNPWTSSSLPTTKWTTS